MCVKVVLLFYGMTIILMLVIKNKMKFGSFYEENAR